MGRFNGIPNNISPIKFFGNVKVLIISCSFVLKASTSYCTFDECMKQKMLFVDSAAAAGRSSGFFKWSFARSFCLKRVFNVNIIINFEIVFAHSLADRAEPSQVSKL